jgi:glycine betaine/proline transport system ATP-binding protein
MEHLRDGASSVTVVEAGAVVGTIRPDGLMGRLLNPQG